MTLDPPLATLLEVRAAGGLPSSSDMIRENSAHHKLLLLSQFVLCLHPHPVAAPSPSLVLLFLFNGASSFLLSSSVWLFDFSLQHHRAFTLQYKMA